MIDNFDRARHCSLPKNVREPGHNSTVSYHPHKINFEREGGIFLELHVPEDLHESYAQLNFLPTGEEEEKEGVTLNREGRESFGILGCQLDARSLILRQQKGDGAGRVAAATAADWAGRGMHIKAELRGRE